MKKELVLPCYNIRWKRQNDFQEELFDIMSHVDQMGCILNQSSAIIKKMAKIQRKRSKY